MTNSVTAHARLAKVLAKDSRRIIGLMSGMSMDGVNLACVDIAGQFPDLTIELRGTHYRSFTPVFAAQLRAGRAGALRDISVLNVLVAEQFAACVTEFMAQTKLEAASVDAIGSHGQTLFHSSDPTERTASTLQVGSPSIIAELTGLITVGNFRVRDIAAGGQGAPLVSLADYVMFRDPSNPVACNNLGSISNVTVVTPELSGVFAFDTGPANMAIDYFASLVPGNTDGIDRDGRRSSAGQCIPELLNLLLASPFFSLPPPKAAGYAEFGPARLSELARSFTDRRPEDLVRTAVEYTAVTMRDAYRRFVLPRCPDLKTVLLSGGGVHNNTLVARIQSCLPELTVTCMGSELSDAKEAIAFAILANETLSGRPGNVPQVTGARRAVVLGEIAL